MAHTVSFSSDTIGAHTQLLTVDGTCDPSTALVAEQRIALALDGGMTQLIFDLRGVTSLGDPMLSVLLRGLIRTRGQNCRFVLVRPNAYVWARFQRSGLDKGFSTFPDLKGALAQVSGTSDGAGK